MQKLSSTQKASASFLVIALALLGLYFTLPSELSSVDTTGTTNNAGTQSDSAVQHLSHQVKNQVSKLTNGISPAPSKESSPQSQVSQAQADHSAWQMGDANAPTPSIPLNEQVAKYTIVAVKKEMNDLPKVGQSVDIPMLDGETIRVNVESVSDNPNGDYTWSGHLQGHGTDYPVVMTYGEHSVFASVTTPQGSYTMESVNGSGWLYKNPSEFELSKPGTKDFLEVDTSH